MKSQGTSPSGHRISIAMCTYNGARYLEEQLATIAQQSRPPCELIVCDDQSTDETVSILNRFQARAPFPVKVIQNPTRLGSTKNFEQAIRLAQGELIALCDQDDRWAPRKLERLSDPLLQDPSLGGVFSDAALIDGEGRMTGSTLFRKHKFTPVKQRNFVSSPTSTLLRHDIVTGATLMFRAAIRQYCLPIPSTWVHDGWLAWIIALHSRWSLVTEPLTYYRIHAGQQLGVASQVGPASGAKAETRRQHYARVAKQFQDLLQHMLTTGWNEHDELILKLREKIAFLERQSTLSQSLGVRALQMLGQLPHYLQYARGIGSIRKDLLLGREML
jgi:hypothetical protein